MHCFHVVPYIHVDIKYNQSLDETLVCWHHSSEQGFYIVATDITFPWLFPDKNKFPWPKKYKTTDLHVVAACGINLKPPFPLIYKDW